MKNIFISILLFLFSLVVFQETTVYVLFKLNQEYITSEYCINKDKPELECYGTCHYQAKVKETKDKSENNPFLQFKHIEFIFTTSIVEEFHIGFDFITSDLFEKFQFLPPQPLFDIFHPPKY
ncbi:MAG: hypothetical protein ACPG4Z_06870 [Chitinophagales bacterium]